MIVATLPARHGLQPEEGAVGGAGGRGETLRGDRGGHGRVAPRAGVLRRDNRGITRLRSSTNIPGHLHGDRGWVVVVVLRLEVCRGGGGEVARLVEVGAARLVLAVRAVRVAVTHRGGRQQSRAGAPAAEHRPGALMFEG